MKKSVYHFLKTYALSKSPILLGLSGGPDSLVLLDILLEIKDLLKLQIGIAHIDHRWRTSSTDEASQLEQLANHYGLPFHLKTLNPETLNGNLEETCRKERLLFFKELSKNHGYQAVLLGHHANDQTETILKKVFEGSELPALHGMFHEAVLDGLKIWRPLLGHRKAEILDWAEKRNLTPFVDATNQDERFLRAKFRKSILPLLSSKFGKNIETCLHRIGHDALELNAYLMNNIQTYLDQIIPGPFGLWLDLSNKGPSSPYELRYLLRHFCDNYHADFSRSQLDLATQLIHSNAANKEIYNKNCVLQIDRKHLFLMKKPLPEWEIERKLVPGMHDFGMWKIEVAYTKEWDSLPTSDWTSLWKGKARVVLNPGDYTLLPPKSHLSYSPSNTLNKWWGNAKIPAFLRYALPIILNGTSVEHEFLSGRQKRQPAQGKDGIAVTMYM